MTDFEYLIEISNHVLQFDLKNFPHINNDHLNIQGVQKIVLTNFESWSGIQQQLFLEKNNLRSEIDRLDI